MTNEPAGRFRVVLAGATPVKPRSGGPFVAKGLVLPKRVSVATYSAERLASKRAQAIAYLGERWVLHPQYRATARHSPANRGPVAIQRRTPSHL